jgi:predicted dehydrogenase
VQKEIPSDHEIEDLVSAQFRFQSGAIGTYLGGTGFPSNEYGITLRFSGATLRSDNAFDPQALQIEWAGGARPELETHFFQQENPFETEIRAWLTALAHNDSIPIPGEDAIRTVAMIESAYASAI